MPTYTNSSAKTVPFGDYVFKPNEVRELYHYIDLSLETDGYVTLTSHAPYFNPIGYVHTLTSSVTSVEISNWEVIDGVEIYNGSSELITVFLNSTSNTYGILVPAGTIRYIRNIGPRVQNLYFTYGGAVSTGEAYVTELKNRDDVELRTT